MKLEPKPGPEHVWSFQNTILFKIISKRDGAVSDGERCFLDLPDTAGTHRESLAAPFPHRSPPDPRGACMKRASGFWDTWKVPDQVLAECGLGMEPRLELLMHPETSDQPACGGGQPRTCPSGPLQTWPRGPRLGACLAGPHFCPNLVSLCQLGPGEKGLAWLTCGKVCQMC